MALLVGKLLPTVHEHSLQDELRPIRGQKVQAQGSFSDEQPTLAVRPATRKNQQDVSCVLFFNFS